LENILGHERGEKILFFVSGLIILTYREMLQGVTINPAFQFIPDSSRVKLYIYMVCSKSIEPLVGRNTFIDLEIQNPNPLQSSLFGNAHTSLSTSAIVGNTSGMRLLEW
jgi:hypothetical protein